MWFLVVCSSSRKDYFSLIFVDEALVLSLRWCSTADTPREPNSLTYEFVCCLLVIRTDIILLNSDLCGRVWLKLWHFLLNRSKLACKSLIHKGLLFMSWLIAVKSTKTGSNSTLDEIRAGMVHIGCQVRVHSLRSNKWSPFRSSVKVGSFAAAWHLQIRLNFH